MSRLEVEPEDYGLVVVAEASAEDIQAAYMLGLVFHADPYLDGVVIGEGEVAQADIRDPDSVHEAALVRHAPIL